MKEDFFMDILDAFDLSDENEELEKNELEEEKKPQEKEVTAEEDGDVQSNTNSVAWDIYYLCTQINNCKYQIDYATDGQQVQSILQQINEVVAQLNSKTEKLLELNQLFINSNVNLNDDINLAEYIDLHLEN